MTDCLNCRHYLTREDFGPDAGLCRRYPPFAVPLPQHQTVMTPSGPMSKPMVVPVPLYPKVGKGDICGEHAAKLGLA